MIYYQHGFGVRELVGAALDRLVYHRCGFCLHDTRSAGRRYGISGPSGFAVGSIVMQNGHGSSIVMTTK